MSKWPMVRLGELGEIASGTTPKTSNPEYWGGDILWVTPAEIHDNTHYVADTDRKITLEGLRSASLSLMPINTVLLSSRAPIGKVAIAKNEMCCNQGFKNIICGERLDPEYLYWYLSNKTSYLNSLGRGATFKEISKGIVENIQIPLPPLDEQKRIAAMLDKAQALIDLRKKQLAEMDLMVKSRFIEMFGDPFQNDKDFEIKVGQDFFKLSNGKPVPEEKRKSCGISAYGGNGVSWYTDEVLYEKDTLVVGRVGFQSGNVHLAKGPLWVTDNAMYLSECNTNEFELVFLGTLMEHIDFTRFQDAGDLKKVTQKPFMQMSYICPPLSLQKEFVAFVAQTDKSKFGMQEGLKILELQYNALMQQSFS